MNNFTNYTGEEWPDDKPDCCDSCGEIIEPPDEKYDWYDKVICESCIDEELGKLKEEARIKSIVDWGEEIE